MAAKANLVGRRYGRLVVVERVGLVDGSSAIHWRCTCDCGGESIAKTGNLQNGSTNSCGCARSERATARNTKHGQYDTPTYRSWKSMLARVRDDRYVYHKGRGFTVCERWFDFANFLTDMGIRPKGTTLDRIDNDKGYEPDNCRWATPKQQAANRRQRGST